MSERCPDCGHPNPPGAESCEACNYPLRSLARMTPGAAPAAPEVPAPGAVPEAATPKPIDLGPRPLRRPVRRGAPLAAQSVPLWLFFGAVLTAILLWTAIDANRQRARQAVAVEGAKPDQQQAADAAQQALARDSSNIDARIALANVLYDTNNWDAAIIHYRAAVRRDSSRVSALVDLGVCYYNLGDTPQAERIFTLALARDPHQPVALFNLGIVNEQHDRPAEALRYYQQALDHAPSADVREALTASMERVRQKMR